ncbi:MAG: hypothetical protein ACRED3_14715, partial [Bradyrhizobium sp.]
MPTLIRAGARRFIACLVQADNHICRCSSAALHKLTRPSPPAAILCAALLWTGAGTAAAAPSGGDSSSAQSTTTINTTRSNTFREAVRKDLTVVLKIEANFTPEPLASNLNLSKSNVNVTADREHNTVGSFSGSAGSEAAASVVDSMNGGTGFQAANQATGLLSSQNIVSSIAQIALTPGSPDFADSEVSIAQRSTVNILQAPAGAVAARPINPNGSPKQMRAASNNSGVVALNQDVGVANAQTFALSMAVGINAIVVLSDAQLSQSHSDNSVPAPSSGSATIDTALNANTGVTGVNQANGSLNNQAIIF